VKTQFFDRQDPKNPINGRVVTRSMEVSELFAAVRTRPPFFAEFIGEGGFKLLVGLASAEGCAQFSAADGSPPYLMAVAPDAANSGGEQSFLIGDTMTPVPKRYCLPYEAIVRLAEVFVDTGLRDTEIRWEEI
jgi:hypothetical protein